MIAISSFVKRYPFVAFVLLNYLLSWSTVIPMHGLLLPWGPMLAALMVVGLTEGRAGVKAMWNRVIHRGTDLRWYVLAVAIPVAISLTAAALNVLLGAPVPQHIDWTTPIRVLPVLLLVSGMWEEPGWTGYALPQLLQRFTATPYGAIVATLFVAAIRTGWHLPLMIYGHVYWSDILSIIGFQFVLAWLYQNSRRSVLVVMLCHLMNNIFVGDFIQQYFVGADWVRYYWLMAGLWCLLAIGALVVSGPNLVRKTVPQSDETAQRDQSRWHKPLQHQDDIG